MPMSKPDGSRRESAPIIRESRMLPTLSLTGSSQGTHFSCTSRAFIPRWAATAATCRVWLDWTPPMDTSVSAPLASASGTMYSSLRTLLPPYARPLLTSSRLAHTSAPPRCWVSRASRWTGLGPNVSGWRGNSCSFIGPLLAGPRGPAASLSGHGIAGEGPRDHDAHRLELHDLRRRPLHRHAGARHRLGEDLLVEGVKQRLRLPHLGQVEPAVGRVHEVQDQSF